MVRYNFFFLCWFHLIQFHSILLFFLRLFSVWNTSAWVCLCWSSVSVKGLFWFDEFSFSRNLLWGPLNVKCKANMEKQNEHFDLCLCAKIYVSLMCDHLQIFKWTDFPLISISSCVAIEFEHFLLQKKKKTSENEHVDTVNLDSM